MHRNAKIYNHMRQAEWQRAKAAAELRTADARRRLATLGLADPPPLTIAQRLRVALDGRGPFAAPFSTWCARAELKSPTRIALRARRPTSSSSVGVAWAKFIAAIM